jgi:hypothetical protein
MTTARMYGAKISETMNWAIPDQAWAPALNRIIWHAIKGAKAPYPGADPYGIPVPQTAQYAWGSLGSSVYPLSKLHGDPRLRIIYKVPTTHHAHS